MRRTKKVFVTILLTVLLATVSMFGFGVISAGAANDSVIAPNDTSLNISVTSPSSGTLNVSVLNGKAGYLYQYWIKTKVATDSSSNLDQYIWKMYGTGFDDEATVNIAVGNDEVIDDKYSVIVRVKEGNTIIDELYGAYSRADVGQPVLSSIEVLGEKYVGEDIVINKAKIGDYAEYYNDSTVYSFLMNECTLNGSNESFKGSIESGTVTFNSDGTFQAYIDLKGLASMVMDDPTILNGTYYIKNGVCHMSGDGDTMDFTIQKQADGSHKGSIAMSFDSYNFVFVCQTQQLNSLVGTLKAKGNIAGMTYNVYYGDTDNLVLTSNDGGMDVNFSTYAAGKHKFRVEAVNGENVAIEYFTTYIYEEAAIFNNVIISDFWGNTDTGTGSVTFTMQLKYIDGHSFAAGDENLFDYTLISGSYTGTVANKSRNGDTITVTFNPIYYGGYGIFQTTATVSKAGQSGEYDKVIVYYEGYSRGGNLKMTPAYGTSIEAGDTVTITATNGKIYSDFDEDDSKTVAPANLRYSFYREDASGWVKIRGEGGNTLEWTPLKAGTYRIQVRIKDVNAASYEKAISYVYNVTETNFVGDVSLDIFNYDGTTVENVIAGKPYKLVAQYLDGNGEPADNDNLLYMFTMKTENLGTIYLNKYSPNNTIMFVPARTGAYDLTARVIDKDSYGYKDAATTLTVTGKVVKRGVTSYDSADMAYSKHDGDTGKGPILTGKQWCDGQDCTFTYDSTKKAIKVNPEAATNEIRVHYGWNGDYHSINAVGEKITFVIEVDKGGASGSTIDFQYNGAYQQNPYGSGSSTFVWETFGDVESYTFENGVYTISAVATKPYIRLQLGINIRNLTNKTQATFYVHKVEIEPNTQNFTELNIENDIFYGTTYTHGTSGNESLYTLVSYDETKKAAKVVLNSSDPTVISAAKYLEVPMNWFNQDGIPSIGADRRVVFVVEFDVNEPDKEIELYVDAVGNSLLGDGTNYRLRKYVCYWAKSGTYTYSVLTPEPFSRFRLCIDIRNLTNKTAATFYIKQVLVTGSLLD